MFDNEVPGPCAYEVKSYSITSPKKGNSIAFIPSGNGRVPFAPSKPYPGPSDYFVKFDGGRSPYILNKKSATFCSISKRDSFFDQQRYSLSIPISLEFYSPAPGPAKYDVKLVESSLNGDVNWNR